MARFDDSLPMILHRTLDAVMPEFRGLFARHNLTEQQWRVLRVLWDTERATSAEIAARTLLLAPSLVGIIDRLEKKGLVARIRSVEDRRNVHVVATAAGRKLGAEVAPEIADINRRIARSVSPEAWSAMTETLALIAQAMSEGGGEIVRKHRQKA